MDIMKACALTRYNVITDGDQVDLSKVRKALVKMGFKDIEENFQEDSSLGWIQLGNWHGVDFPKETWNFNEFIIFSLRQDLRTTAGSAVSRYVERKVQVLMNEQKRMVSKKERRDIKEEVEQELRAKSLLSTATYDVIWWPGLKDSMLWFFSADKKARGVFEDYFRTTFNPDIRLELIGAYSLAPRLRPKTKAWFTLPPTADLLDRLEEGAFLGPLFLMWLYKASLSGEVKGLRKEYEIRMSQSLLFQDDKRKVMLSGTGEEWPEADTAASNNRKLVKAKIDLVDGEDQYSWVQDYGMLDFKSLKAKIDGIGLEGEGPLMEMLYKEQCISAFLMVFEDLFAGFLESLGSTKPV